VPRASWGTASYELCGKEAYGRSSEESGVFRYDPLLYYRGSLGQTCGERILHSIGRTNRRPGDPPRRDAVSCEKSYRS
jgi:hypothetical protein